MSVLKEVQKLFLMQNPVLQILFREHKLAPLSRFLKAFLIFLKMNWSLF
jgi:hypothetical protein